MCDRYRSKMKKKLKVYEKICVKNVRRSNALTACVENMCDVNMALLGVREGAGSKK